MEMELRDTYYSLSFDDDKGKMKFWLCVYQYDEKYL
jgi:hypothetical protein